MDVSFRFEITRRPAADASVPPGVVAVFVDYGDKNEGLTFDHHACSGDSSSTSILCSEAGLCRLREGLTEASASSICVVTHSSPDLDSVGAATVVHRFASGQETALSPGLVQYIRDKDQGLHMAESPRQSLSILFQAVKNCSGNDVEVMERGIQLVQVVDEAIRKGMCHLGWNDLTDIQSIRTGFSSELSLVADEVQLARSCLSEAPKTLLAVPAQAESGMPSYRWADATVVDFSTLGHEPLGWKDIIRSDRSFTMTGNACPFMAVRSRKHDRDNYIISVEPHSGLSLKGLGAHLDHLESLRSSQLDKAPDTWDPRIRSIAEFRSGSETMSLCRSKRPARQGYDNSDPWYDGRGHEFTIVDTPDSGSVLTDNEILLAILCRYSPFWRENLVADSIVATAFDAQTGEEQPLAPNWLHRFVPSWEGEGSRSAEALNASQESMCLADAISSVATLNMQTRQMALYLPVTSSSPQTIPREDHLLHVMNALYLMAHRRQPIDCTPPSQNTIQKWAERFVATPSPGLWWTVAPELGLLMLDYVGGHAVRQTFDRVSEGYFATIRQLTWTDSLSPVVRQRKRHEAIADFVTRYATR